MTDSNCITVTEDWVRYAAQAKEKSQSNFLVEDPDWAVDFAPNGMLPYPLPVSQDILFMLAATKTVTRKASSSWRRDD